MPPLDSGADGGSISAPDGSGSPQPVLTRHIYAGIETLEEHVCCDVSASGGQCADPSGFALAREFIWGERFPEPIAMIDHTDLGDAPAGTPEVLHYLHDILGSVVALTDSTSSVVERYTYEPYGRTVIEQTEPGTGGPLRDPQTGDPTGRLAASRFGNLFYWTAQRYDASVGLYHFLFRSYAPRLGRWLQRDPIGVADSLNLYEATHSNPLLLQDLFGLCGKHPKIDPARIESTLRRIIELIKQGKPWYDVLMQLIRDLQSQGLSYQDALALISQVAGNLDFIPKPLADYLDLLSKATAVITDLFNVRERCRQARDALTEAGGGSTAVVMGGGQLCIVSCACRDGHQIGINIVCKGDRTDDGPGPSCWTEAPEVGRGMRKANHLNSNPPPQCERICRECAK